MALHALSQPAHHPRLAPWATATAAAFDPCLADRLLEADFLWRSSFSDIFMPFAGDPRRHRTPRRDPGRGARRARRPRRRALRDGRPRTLLARALQRGRRPLPLKDPSSRARVLEAAAARGPAQLRFSRRLLDDTAAVRVWLRRLLEDCDEAFFAETWQRTGPQQAADARHKTEVLRRKGLSAALRRPRRR